MTNEELEKLNQRLDKLELKLDEVIKQNKSSRVFKGCGLLIGLIGLILIVHVLVIGGVSAYTLLKGDTSTETGTNTTAPSTSVTPTDPVK